MRTRRPVRPELSIAVPTINERSNIRLLVARLQRTFDGIDWEVIFVDDNSPDGSAAAARAIGVLEPRAAATSISRSISATR